MTPITLSWVNEWAHQHRISVAGDALLSLTYDDATPQRRVTVLTDSERVPGAVVLFANRLVWVEPEDEAEEIPDDDRTFVYWIRESGIWDEMAEALASEAFSALMKAHGQPPAAVGLLIPPTESRVAVLLCLHAILFGWDVYLSPLSGKWLCRISHDGYVDVRAQSEAILGCLKERLDVWGAEFRPI
jgi:hypothetical protein